MMLPLSDPPDPPTLFFPLWRNSPDRFRSAVYSHTYRKELIWERTKSKMLTYGELPECTPAGITLAGRPPCLHSSCSHIVLISCGVSTFSKLSSVRKEASRSAGNGIYSYGPASRRTLPSVRSVSDLLEESQSADLRIPRSTSSSGDPHRDYAGVAAAKIRFPARTWMWQPSVIIEFKSISCWEVSFTSFWSLTETASRVSFFYYVTTDG